MNVIGFIVGGIFNLILTLLRGTGQGLWVLIHGILAGLGRWIGRVVLPVGVIVGALWFLSESMSPERFGNMIGQLIVIAIMGYAIWNMITSPFRSKKNRRR